MHIVLSGNYGRTIDDLVNSGWSIDPRSMTGTDDVGNPVRIVHCDNPERLYGVTLTSYEWHRSAIGHRRLTECVRILRARGVE